MTPEKRATGCNATDAHRALVGGDGDLTRRCLFLKTVEARIWAVGPGFADN